MDSLGPKSAHKPISQSQDANILGETSQIASKLKQLYNSIQEEELPERFINLLARLEQAEKKAKRHPK